MKLPFFDKELPKLNDHFLKIILPVHILTISLILYGVDIVWWQVIVSWAMISGFGIAIGFHRYFSHRSFETWKPIRYALALLGCLSGQGSPIFWVGLHRGSHHRHADTELDVHSPIHGFLTSFILWQVFFKADDRIAAKVFATTKDLVRDPYLVWLHKKYNKLIWGIIIVSLAIDFSIGLSIILLPMLLSSYQENVINSFCHTKQFGYRNFDTPDNSVNIWLLGLLCFGHGYHNNHHASPNDYNFGSKWYEFDICKPLIYLIKK